MIYIFSSALILSTLTLLICDVAQLCDLSVNTTVLYVAARCSTWNVQQERKLVLVLAGCLLFLLRYYLLLPLGVIIIFRSSRPHPFSMVNHKHGKCIASSSGYEKRIL